MGAGIKFLLGVGRLALNSHREDGKVVELHGIALEHKFLDTSHHVGKDSKYLTAREVSVMVGHVLRKLWEVEHFAIVGSGVVLAVGLALAVALIYSNGYCHSLVLVLLILLCCCF